MNVPTDALPPPLSGRLERAPLTSYEKAAVVSARAAMLANGAEARVSPGVGPSNSPFEVAKREYEEGAMPMFVERPLGIDKGVLCVKDANRNYG